MKAFQLKIAIKNSKPPIWRRVIVPAGITFSQLSIILNKVMGWCGYHLFEFEFYHLELRIAEDAEEFDVGYGPYDYVEASSTYIREYLEENDWFTYTYDLGDEWQHRVTVEKTIEDYQYNYPQVIKFKGDCPVEDCGGIYGYYECLEIINDKTHPEYEERLMWMKSQGYPDEYDMDYVNGNLERECFYNWGKGEKRCQNEIYEEHFSGKYGLHATKRDKNKNEQLNMSRKHRLEAAMEEFRRAFEYEMQWKQKLALPSLADIFEDYEKEDILEIAKGKGVQNISKCNKSTLSKCLVTHMLQSEVARKYFLCLQDEEIEEFEKAIKENGVYEPEKAGRFLILYEAAYIGMLDDGRVMVPKDVAVLYSSFKGKAFDEERKQISYLLCCLRTISCLYGIAPFQVLVKLMNRNQLVQMTEEEINAAIHNLPPEHNEYVIAKDVIYNADLYPDDRGLRAAQGNKEFYIPTMDEIIEFGTKGYSKKSIEANKLKQFLIRKMDAMPEEAEFACGIIQMQITGDCQMQDIFNVFEDLGLALKKESQIQELVECINELWNNTRMLLNRGFTPNELLIEEQKMLRPLSGKGNVIDFVQAKKNKIYPNDLCPCGSGKKYKNCCKNKNMD